MRTSAESARDCRGKDRTVEARSRPRASDSYRRPQRERLPRHSNKQVLQRVFTVLARQHARIAFEHNFAAREEEDAVAYLRDFVHVVRRPEYAAIAFPREFADTLADFPPD